jgi:enterochelin esterase-like enzyme
MALSGSLFVGSLVIITVVAFVAVVVRWPFMAGRTPGRILGRVGSLLGVNFLVLLTAAAILNAQFLFFADWTDLRGAFNGPPTATGLRAGGEAGRAARSNVRGEAAPATPGLVSLPKGTSTSAGIFTYRVKGPASGVTASVVVVLPAGYSDLAKASTHYPVIEAFQGYPGSASTWTRSMDIGGAIAARVAAKRMSPALIVIPQLQIPAGVDTECVNGAAGNGQIETWVAKDVPNWVATHFRVQTRRQSWATIGLSAGAWCAAMVTTLHPAQYSAAIVMGGYFRPNFGPFYQPYPPRSALANRYDLVALARRGAPPPVAIWLETSHTDTVSYLSSVEFLKASTAPMAVDATVLQHAGHRISLWKRLLPDALNWLGANIPGFSPKA